jgi:hypothetical protein
MLRVQLPIGHGQQPIEDLPILVFGRWFGQTTQTPAAIEVRNPRAFDEDLLYIGAGEQISQRAEIGDGSQYPAHHRLRVPERDLLAESGVALIIVYCAFDLAMHLGELSIRLQSTPLDAGNRIVADDVVGIQASRHRGVPFTTPRRVAYRSPGGAMLRRPHTYARWHG